MMNCLLEGVVLRKLDKQIKINLAHTIPSTSVGVGKNVLKNILKKSTNHKAKLWMDQPYKDNSEFLFSVGIIDKVWGKWNALKSISY